MTDTVLFKFKILRGNLYVRSLHITLTEHVGVLIDQGDLLNLHILCHIVVGSAVPSCARCVLIVALPEVFKIVELRFAFNDALAVFGEGSGCAPAI